jgi:outer membrane biosynthesis protein TonB
MGKDINIVNKQDQRVAIIVAVSVIALLIIYLKLAYYLMADPAPKEYKMEAKMDVTKEEIDLQDFKLNEPEGARGGSGTPKDAPIVKEPRNQTEKVLTQSNSKTEVPTGESTSSTEKPNPTNESSTRVKGPNPFGSGGAGGGKEQGKGGPFGDDDGPGGGHGNEGTGHGGVKREPRQRITDPAPVPSNYSGIVVLNVTINADGNVIKAVNLSSESTITDIRIVNQYIANVRSSVKYNKKPGTTPQVQKLTINVKAS